MVDTSSFPLLKHRLLSGGAWALGGRVLIAFFALTTNALLARLLPAQDLGAYFLAFSVVLFCTQLGALGLNRSIVRFVAESMGLEQSGRARRAVRLTLLIGSAGAFGVATVYFFLGGFLAEEVFHSPAMASVSGLMAGWIVVMIFQLLLSETFRGFHDIRMATIFGGSVAGLGLVTGGLLATSLLALLLVRGDAELATVVLLAVGAGVTSVLLSGWALSHKVSSFPEGETSGQIQLREVLGVSWPLLITSLTLFALTQADLWIVGIFSPQEDVALYGAASRMVMLVAMPLTIVNAVMPPLISEMYAQGRIRELERALRATATFAGIPSFLVLMSLVVAGAPIMHLIFGAYYREAALILALLSLGQLVNVWGGSCGLALMLTGHQREMMAITVLSSALIIIGALWTVHFYGPVGVAGIAAAGMTLQNLFMLGYTKKRIGVWTHAELNFSRLRALIK